jgi:Binding-protein-dependent transport system inner membrane component
MDILDAIGALGAPAQKTRLETFRLLVAHEPEGIAGAHPRAWLRGDPVNHHLGDVFPAFVTIAQGVLLVPPAALDLPRAYGAGRWTPLRLVSIPASLPYLLAATRVTVPRALLGVMIAEWLAAGTGLGNLLNQSRGYLD